MTFPRTTLQRNTLKIGSIIVMCFSIWELHKTPTMTKPDTNLIGNRNLDELRTDLALRRHPVDVAVYSIDNYFNLGAIVRICHNFQVRSVIAIDIPKYYRKADMGTRKYETILKVSMDDFVRDYSHRNIVALEKRPGLETQDLRNYMYPENPILLFGSEKIGIHNMLLSKARDVVSIPMYGLHNDHNVAVACGIVLYDYVSKRV